MGLAKSEAEWAERASTFLKAKLKESEITYVELGLPSPSAAFPNRSISPSLM